MPRKRKKSSPLPWIALAVGVILVVAAFLMLSKDEGGKSGHRGSELLDVATYLENANSLRGNVYVVEGTIDNQLAWSKTGGRLISVTTGDKTNKDILAILVPSKFDNINLQKGQRFAFEVEVGDQGIISARSLKKT